MYLAAKKAVRRPYVYSRGPQARTLIREQQRQQPQFKPKGCLNLEALWHAKTLVNSIYDNQNHENGNCSCHCTPVPKQNPTCPPDDKRRRKREDRHHLRGRPFAQIQPPLEKEGY